MNIHVTANPGETTGQLTFQGKSHACALGRTGIIPDVEKQEGDGATPAGRWVLRRLLYRADRMPKPVTHLPANAIHENDGWCDALEDEAYNCPVHLPYKAKAENLWRNDDLYNLIVVLGHNDDPVVPGKGSAIFFHVAKQTPTGLAATEGCVALPEPILKEILESCSTRTVMDIALPK